MPLLLLHLLLITSLFVFNFFLIFILKANTYCFFFFDIQFLDLLFIVIFFLIFLSLKTKHLITTLLSILFIFIFFSFGLFSIFVQLPTLMFIIVYLGALMMLFVFVVMLFSAQQNKIENVFYKNFGFFFFSFFAYKTSIIIFESSRINNNINLYKKFWNFRFMNDFFFK